MARSMESLWGQNGSLDEFMGARMAQLMESLWGLLGKKKAKMV